MGKKADLPDGMRLRGKVYWSDFQVQGIRHREPLGRDLGRAKGKLAEMKAAAYRGDVVRAKKVTWTSICEGYLEAKAKHLRTGHEMRRALEKFNTFLSEEAWTDNPLLITVDLVEKYRIWRRLHRFRQANIHRPVANRTMNKEVTIVQAALKWASSGSRQLIPRNPLADLSHLPTDNPTKVRRSLTSEEVSRLLETMTAPLRDIVMFISGTGCRSSEAINLLFSDVDFERKTAKLTTDRTKSKKTRTLPLSPPILEMLTRRKAEAPLRTPADKGSYLAQARRNFSREHVFVTAYRTKWMRPPKLLKSFQAACERAGIEGAVAFGSIDIHALRVTFTTLALDAGADLNAVSKILGHYSPAFTLAIYDRATEDAKHAAAAMLPWLGSVTNSSQNGPRRTIAPPRKGIKKRMNGIEDPN